MDNAGLDCDADVECDNENCTRGQSPFCAFLYWTLNSFILLKNANFHAAKNMLTP